MSVFLIEDGVLVRYDGPAGSVAEQYAKNHV